MIINGRTLLEMAPITDMATVKYQQHGVSYGLTECGYDIRLKQTICFRPKGDDHEQWWLSNQKYNGTYPDYWDESGNGNFVLGSSIEHFQMPNNLMGRVLNKSTWARKGLDASMTTNIEPSWNGHLTIELIYHGQNELIIPAGSGICGIIFETLAEPANYDGKYANQPNRPVEAIMTETGPKYKECRDPIGCSHFGGCTC